MKPHKHTHNDITVAKFFHVYSSKEYEAGRTSLLHQFASHFDTYNIPCYVSTGCGSSKPVQYRYLWFIFARTHTHLTESLVRTNAKMTGFLQRAVSVAVLSTGILRLIICVIWPLNLTVQGMC